MNSLLENQFFLRILFSISGLVVFWGLALLFPFRKNQELKSIKRLSSNLTFTFGNGALVSILIPLTLVQISTLNSLQHWQFFKLPTDNFWISFAFGVISLDFLIYWQHRLTHTIPLLWRLHRVHHSDIEFDTTTAGRFHTIEIFFSFFIKAIVVVLFGIAPEAIVVFEIILNFSALFNHSNFALPKSFEKIVRLFVITPTLHRIHHSTHNSEMNQNFGFSISLWDRLFKSYLGKNKENQLDMPIGLKEFRTKKDQSLTSLLKQPF